MASRILKAERYAELILDAARRDTRFVSVDMRWLARPSL